MVPPAQAIAPHCETGGTRAAEGEKRQRDGRRGRLRPPPSQRCCTEGVRALANILKTWIFSSLIRPICQGVAPRAGPIARTETSPSERPDHPTRRELSGSPVAPESSLRSREGGVHFGDCSSDPPPACTEASALLNHLLPAAAAFARHLETPRSSLLDIPVGHACTALRDSVDWLHIRLSRSQDPRIAGARLPSSCFPRPGVGARMAPLQRREGNE